MFNRVARRAKSLLRGKPELLIRPSVTFSAKQSLSLIQRPFTTTFFKTSWDFGLTEEQKQEILEYEKLQKQKEESKSITLREFQQLLSEQISQKEEEELINKITRNVLERHLAYLQISNYQESSNKELWLKEMVEKKRLIEEMNKLADLPVEALAPKYDSLSIEDDEDKLLNRDVGECFFEAYLQLQDGHSEPSDEIKDAKVPETTLPGSVVDATINLKLHELTGKYYTKMTEDFKASLLEKKEKGTLDDYLAKLDEERKLFAISVMEGKATFHPDDYKRKLTTYQRIYDDLKAAEDKKKAEVVKEVPYVARPSILKYVDEYKKLLEQKKARGHLDGYLKPLKDQHRAFSLEILEGTATPTTEEFEKKLLELSWHLEDIPNEQINVEKIGKEMESYIEEKVIVVDSDPVFSLAQKIMMKLDPKYVPRLVPPKAVKRGELMADLGYKTRHAHRPDEYHLDPSKQFQKEDFTLLNQYLMEADFHFFRADFQDLYVSQWAGDHNFTRSRDSDQTPKYIQEIAKNDYIKKTFVPFTEGALYYDKARIHGKSMNPAVVYTKLVVAGNGKGAAGWGKGKALDNDDLALEKALDDVYKNLVPISLYEGRTVWRPARAKYNGTYFIINPMPRGSGCTGAPIVQTILECFGIQDASTRLFGTRNEFSQIKVIFEAIAQAGMTDSKEDALARGVHYYRHYEPGYNQMDPEPRREDLLKRDKKIRDLLNETFSDWEKRRREAQSSPDRENAYEKFWGYDVNEDELENWVPEDGEYVPLPNRKHSPPPPKPPAKNKRY